VEVGASLGSIGCQLIRSRNAAAGTHHHCQIRATLPRLNANVEEKIRADAHVNRVTAMGQLAASIVHETMQPIAGAVINPHAGLRFLSADPPNVEEVRHALDRIAADGNHASDVIAKLRALEGAATKGQVGGQ
jgi:C4-dicarboxylate-specific signal transduction histidine kinase